MSKTKEDYPNRYYASYCQTRGHITGWYDTHNMTLDNVPDEKDLFALSADEWKNRKMTGQGVKDGKLSDMEIVIEVPIIYQATNSLKDIREYIQIEYLMMNEAVPNDFVDYQRKLKAIIDGSDTTSTTLPESPIR